MNILATLRPNEVMERLLGYRNGVLGSDARWVLAGFRISTLLLFGLLLSFLAPLLIPAAAVLAIITAMWTARLAVRFTMQHTADEQIQLLRLTHLSEIDIVRGISLAALYRTRTTITGVFTATAGGGIGWLLAALCASADSEIASSTEGYLRPLLALLTLDMALFALIFTAAAGGVLIALAVRSDLTATLIAPLGVLALALLPAGLSLMAGAVWQVLIIAVVVNGALLIGQILLWGWLHRLAARRGAAIKE